MTIRLIVGIVVGIVLGVAPSARAQGSMFWFDAGQHQTHYDNGDDKGGASFGGGLLFTIGGSAGKNSGVIVPLGFDFKASWGASFDLVGGGDIAFRVRNVSFGPGLNVGFLNRSHRDDARCLVRPLPTQSSCFTSGRRDIGGFVALAPSGFIKTSFGPQGRGFAQLRYLHYTPGLMNFLSSSEMFAAFEAFSALSGVETEVADNTEPFHPVDFPEFEKGRDIRVAAGWVFGGANTKAKVLRVQYSEKKFDFTRVLANGNGFFNQKLRQITVGAGFAF